MRVTVVADNLPLKQVLSIMFKDSDIKWKIKGNNVIIKKKTAKAKVSVPTKLAMSPSFR